MEKELTQKSQDIALFDSAKESVTKMVVELQNCLVTSHENREMLFEMCKTSKQKLKAVDNKRLEFNRPIAEDKKKLKSNYEKAIAPLDKRKSDIEEYVATLRKPLETAMNDAKTRIIMWDDEQARIKAAELAKIEEEKRLQREKEEQEERERQEKIRLENECIEAEKQAKIDEANKLSGIEARKAQVLADLKAKEEKDRLEKEAQKQATMDSIDNAIARSELNDKLDNLNVESKGQKKKFYEAIGMTDESLIPREYLIVRVNWVKIKEDVKAGKSEIPGVEIVEKQDLQFRKSKV